MKKKEDEITRKIRKLEDESERIDFTVRQYKRDEEYQEIKIKRSLAELERMSASCSESDYEIRKIIDKKKQIVRTIQQENKGLAEEIRKKIAAEKNRVEMERSELNRELRVLRERKEKKGRKDSKE